MILAIALTLIHIAIDWFCIEVEFTWWKIKKKRTSINHALHEGIFFAAVAIGTLLTMNAFFFAIAYGVKLFIFGPILNLVRGKKWYYQSKEEHASRTDKIFRKLNKYVVLGIRVCSLVLGMWVYYN